MKSKPTDVGYWAIYGKTKSKQLPRIYGNYISAAEAEKEAQNEFYSTAHLVYVYNKSLKESK